MSFTYRNQIVRGYPRLIIALFSETLINKFEIIGNSDEFVGSSSLCRYRSPEKKNGV